MTMYRSTFMRRSCNSGRHSSPAAILALGMEATTAGHAAIEPRREFADLSLEELANIQVTSVSKKVEPLSNAPTTIYVITGENIRRSRSKSERNCSSS